MAHLRAKMLIYFACKAQIALLIIEKVIIPAKYFKFVDIFSKKSATELFKQTKINKYMINLKSNKQPPYGPIYSQKPRKLETFKTYIKINWANGFIQSSKSPTRSSIFFF